MPSWHRAIPDARRFVSPDVLNLLRQAQACGQTTNFGVWGVLSVLEGMQRNRQAVPEALAVQEYWSRVILPDGFVTEFKVGRELTPLRLGVPRRGSDVKKGICCVYFVAKNHHFLAMVSEKELNKMEFTLGTGRDKMPATNHALTLRYGMKAGAKKMGWNQIDTVQACFGFWFDVSRDDGELFSEWKADCRSCLKTGTPVAPTAFSNKLDVDISPACTSMSRLVTWN